MSACGSKRKESRPSPSLSLSPPSLGPLLLSRSLLPLSPLSFSLALSFSLSRCAGVGEMCASLRWRERERERETRFAARDWWRGALRCGEGRFAARERDRESCAAPRSRPTPISFSFNPNPAPCITSCSPELQRCFNPSRAQSKSWARSGMRISRAFLCVCLCFACVPADLR